MDSDYEKALIERAQLGDLPAYQELFTIYRPRIFRIVDHLLKDRADADDVVQDIFLKVFKVLDTYRHQSSFFTWVYRIATNAARARLAAKTRSSHIMVDSGNDAIEQIYSSEYDQPDIVHGRAEVVHILDSAIASLSPTLREAFLLREVDGLDYNEIAQLTNVPLGTVKSRISRAKLYLAEQVGPYHIGSASPQMEVRSLQSAEKGSNQNESKNSEQQSARRIKNHSVKD